MIGTGATIGVTGGGAVIAARGLRSFFWCTVRQPGLASAGCVGSGGGSMAGGGGGASICWGKGKMKASCAQID
jgi:hypothetical protein